MKFRRTPKQANGITSLVEDSTPSSYNKDDAIRVQKVVEAVKGDSGVKTDAPIDSSSLEKIMSRLSSEMIKETTQQKQEIIDQIHKEKQELKLEWQKLQNKINVRFDCLCVVGGASRTRKFQKDERS